MSIFSADDYRKEAEKNIALERAKTKRRNKPHWEVQHRISSNQKADKTRWKFYCPRLCQQKDNGSKGKKTFDGKICNKCGYEQKAQKT